MCIDYEAENWFGNPTPEEMYKHHAKIVDAENELLRLEVDRYRRNQAKLIDMLSEIRASRDKLGKDLAAAKKQLSNALLDASNLGNKVAGLERCREQLEDIHRERRHAAAAGHKLRVDPTA